MDNVGALNVFVRAAEARSFTEAGRQLGVSSSAIGKAIARLEERLAVRLFHRSTRSIALTQEGTLFLESCRRIFAEIETAELELAQIKRAPSGTLRVSLPLVGMLLMPTLSRFIAAYPDVELDLDFTDRMVNVIDDGFDVVVRTGEVSDSRLPARHDRQVQPYAGGVARLLCARGNTADARRLETSRLFAAQISNDRQARALAANGGYLDGHRFADDGSGKYLEPLIHGWSFRWVHTLRPRFRDTATDRGRFARSRARRFYRSHRLVPRRMAIIQPLSISCCPRIS